MNAELEGRLFRREGIQVELIDTREGLREAQRFRHRVFCLERDIIPPKRGQLDADEYDDRARHIAVRRRDGGLAATARVILGSEVRGLELPMQRYCGATVFAGLPMFNVGEISRFAISKQGREDRSPLLRLALLRGILQASEEEGLTHWCAMMEPGLVRLLRSTGVVFTPVGTMVDVWGWRLPCLAAIHHALSVGQRARPEFYDIVAGDQEFPLAIAANQTARLETSRAARRR